MSPDFPKKSHKALTQGDEGGEHRNHNDIDNRILDNNPPSLSFLLHREKGCPNLLGGAKPDYTQRHSPSAQVR